MAKKKISSAPEFENPGQASMSENDATDTAREGANPMTAIEPQTDAEIPGVGPEDQAPEDEGDSQILSLDITPLEPEPKNDGELPGLGPADEQTAPGITDADAPDLTLTEKSGQEAESADPTDPAKQIPMPEKATLKPAKAPSERQSFYDLAFNELDRDLSDDERQEWNSIYASYRGRSALTGTIIGVDRHTVNVRNRQTDEVERQEMYCAIVVPFRVRIIIPATEMWDDGQERPGFVLQNMVGAAIDFVIIKVDREGSFAIASRRQAARSRRYYFSRRPALHSPGAKIKCRILAVGPRRCLVECYGHDINLTQRELRYTAIPDLRTEYRPGEELSCLVKAYDSEQNKLAISVKETQSNPFDGAEMRHPAGSRRQAVIAGKYGGGVFCNLPDGTVCMCAYSFQHEDSEFQIGDTAIVAIQRFDRAKMQIYGKIISKW